MERDEQESEQHCGKTGIEGKGGPARKEREQKRKLLRESSGTTQGGPVDSGKEHSRQRWQKVQKPREAGWEGGQVWLEQAGWESKAQEVGQSARRVWGDPGSTAEVTLSKGHNRRARDGTWLKEGCGCCTLSATQAWAGGWARTMIHVGGESPLMRGTPVTVEER